jgi:hypothetical protein
VYIILYCCFPIASVVDFDTEVANIKHTLLSNAKHFLFPLSLSLSLSLSQVRAGGEDAERVVHENQLDIVRLLVAHGADLSITDEAGTIP